MLESRFVPPIAAARSEIMSIIVIIMRKINIEKH
jgi:hypothetical protein